HALGHLTLPVGFGLFHGEIGIGIGNVGLGQVLTRHGRGFLLLHVNPSIGLGLFFTFFCFRLVDGHLNVFFTDGGGLTDDGSGFLLLHVYTLIGFGLFLALFGFGVVLC